MSPRAADITALIERFDHLRNSGVCSPTTRAVLDEAQALIISLPTPPADDVSEALASSDEALTLDQVMQHAYANAVTRAPGRMTWGEALREFATWMRERDARLIAEIRPHGTVTDAEESMPVKLLRMFVREHDEGDGPEQVAVEVSDLRHVLRLLDAALEAAQEVHP